MNNTIDKNLIKKRFERSLKTYSDNAFIQNKMAANLLQELVKNCGNKFDKILEIGCGTGTLTKGISSNLIFNELFINDLIEKAVNQTSNISDKIKKVYGDIEAVSLPTDLDLAISNATFQWFENPELILDKISSSLKKRGIFAFTTFGEQNFYQIKKILGKSLNYKSKWEIEQLLNNEFEIIFSSAETINLEFDTVMEMLKHLKLTGVNALNSTIWTKKDLENFSREYEEFFKNSDNKLILTYHPQIFIAIKK